MFIALLTEAKVEARECLSVDKVWYTHTVEYYSALKRKGILTHAPAQTDCGDVMLSEISQPQKTNPRRFYFCEVRRSNSERKKVEW